MLPALFVSHGSPDIALRKTAWADALRRFAGSLPAVSAVAVISAHWEAPVPARVTTSPAPETIHDFSGFAPALYGVRYPCPGAPEVAARIGALLGAAGIGSKGDGERGLDHGAWVPLRVLFPKADLPAVAISLPRPRTPASLVALGRALSPLREEGVLLVGSGGLVHNLGLLEWEERDAPPATWAVEFETWVRNRLPAHDEKDLLGYRARAPHGPRAHPTTEHFDPLFAILGAAGGDPVRSVHEGFEYGTLSMGCVSFGG